MDGQWDGYKVSFVLRTLNLPVCRVCRFAGVMRIFAGYSYAYARIMRVAQVLMRIFLLISARSTACFTGNACAVIYLLINLKSKLPGIPLDPVGLYDNDCY